MKTHRIAIAITAVNLVILVLGLVLVVRPAVSPDVAPVLRGHALEIVDDQGKVRAEIIVAPSTTSSDGQAYPETVLFRLIDPRGMPGLKVGTSAEGSGLLLSRESDGQEWSGVQILAESSGSLIRLMNEDGREQVIEP